MDTSTNDYSSFLVFTEKVGQDTYGEQPLFQPPYIPTCSECEKAMRFGFEILNAPYITKNFPSIKGLMFFTCEPICISHAVVPIPISSSQRESDILICPNVEKTKIEWVERVEPSVEIHSSEQIELLSDDVLEELSAFKIGGFFPFFDDSGRTSAELGCIGFLPWMTPNLTFYLFHNHGKFTVELF